MLWCITTNFTPATGSNAPPAALKPAARSSIASGFAPGVALVDAGAAATCVDAAEAEEGAMLVTLPGVGEGEGGVTFCAAAFCGCAVDATGAPRDPGPTRTSAQFCPAQ